MITPDQVALYRRLFQYLSSWWCPSGHESLEYADLGFVFGRKSQLVARRAAELQVTRQVGRTLVTGAIGKDSGDLAALGLTESGWLIEIMVSELQVNRDHVIQEPTATNGGENCRRGLDAALAAGVLLGSITAVAHATSLRRLATMLHDELAHRGLHDVKLQATPTAYAFDPFNPDDRKEARDELTRLVKWPHQRGADGRPFLSPQPAGQEVPAEFLALLDTD